MKRIAFAVAALLLVSSTAQAQVLNFEGINATYPSGFAFVQGFYNGGTSSVGTTGTNLGIAFSDNAQAICLNSLTVYCSNTSRGGLGDPSSQQNGLFFLSGNATYMNSAIGFLTGFSFFYVSASQPGSFTVWDGLGGTGSILATLNLAPNAEGCLPGYSAGFCPFSAAGVGFSGTAHSVTFAGVANQIVFDDVTFGSSTPGLVDNVVPEPSSMALLVPGLLSLGAVARRRKQRA
jgi:hypothetical protein